MLSFSFGNSHRISAGSRNILDSERKSNSDGPTNKQKTSVYNAQDSKFRVSSHFIMSEVGVSASKVASS
jgi:hypothetical protein